MRLALDTNRYTDLCRGDPEVVANVARAEAVFMTFVVIAELHAGFAVGTRGHENERTLRNFLRKPNTEVLWANDATVRCYAALFRQLRMQGTPIPTNDLWTAALVTQHALVLYSRDAHFRALPQLQILD